MSIETLQEAVEGGTVTVFNPSLFCLEKRYAASEAAVTGAPLSTRYHAMEALVVAQINKWPDAIYQFLVARCDELQDAAKIYDKPIDLWVWTDATACLSASCILVVCLMGENTDYDVYPLYRWTHSCPPDPREVVATFFKGRVEAKKNVRDGALFGIVLMTLLIAAVYVFYKL